MLFRSAWIWRWIATARLQLLREPQTSVVRSAARRVRTLFNELVSRSSNRSSPFAVCYRSPILGKLAATCSATYCSEMTKRAYPISVNQLVRRGALGGIRTPNLLIRRLTLRSQAGSPKSISAGQRLSCPNGNVYKLPRPITRCYIYCYIFWRPLWASLLPSGWTYGRSTLCLRATGGYHRGAGAGRICPGSTGWLRLHDMRRQLYPIPSWLVSMV